ncbi:condensation domain-containing protein [Vibrio sp. PP-XX7]
MLQQCHGIQEAVVVAQGEEEKRLVAYYTLAASVAQKGKRIDDGVDDGVDDNTTGESGVTPEGLKAQLSEQLPVYMVPAAYVALPHIPLTVNGKVDRKALPVPDKRAFIRQTYEAPQGEIETTLATIWQSLLGVAQVGRHDNFFELGGHSLMAVQLIEQLRQHGYHLAVKSLFNQPVLAALAIVISNRPVETTIEIPANLIPEDCTHITPAMLPLVTLSQTDIDQVTATVSGGAANVQDIYPLAPLQEGILFHHLLDETGDPYVTRFIQAFTSQDELQVFTQALEAVIQRHDILRTGIVWDGLPEPVQVVWRHASLPVTMLTFGAENAETGDHTEIDDIVAALQQQFDPTRSRMNIQRAPMIEAYQAADPANNRWLLCLLFHHLCNDHTTMELLAEEVQSYLFGHLDQLPTPLPFRNFVAQARLGSDRGGANGVLPQATG